MQKAVKISNLDKGRAPLIETQNGKSMEMDFFILGQAVKQAVSHCLRNQSECLTTL